MATAKKKAAKAAKPARTAAARGAAAKKPAKPAAKAAAKAPARKPAAGTRPAKTTAKAGSADLVDDQLARYRSMRDFAITQEPSGDGAKARSKAKADGAASRSTKPGELPFVIQKHAASHLHYDFRLGWNGVLKSWACAKGPSFYPGDRRLAVQVEDHPIEYGGFEGIIPKGQYGGGTVMVWDQGTWWLQPGHEDVDAGLKSGSLKFEMSGTKMKGKWTLVRMGPRSSSSSGSRWGSSDKPNWLLIKEHDDYERGKDDKPITDEKPDSAVTGRSLEQIANSEDHVWNSKDTAREAGRAWFRKEPAAPSEPAPRDTSTTPEPALAGSTVATSLQTAIAALPKEPQPDFLSPQLALEATTPPDGAGWVHELKLDGYRIQARKDGRKVAMLTRKGLDWTHRMPAVAAALAALPVKQATFDGEVVVLTETGTTSFADLQAAFQEGAKHKLTYFVFDLLHANGRNTRKLPLRERKALLARILPPGEGVVRLSEHLETGGPEMFEKACELHAEGIISKRADATYSGGRSSSWLKSKCLREQELIIGGYTDSSEGNDRIGSLVLGYYDNGELIYAGRTGTGFTQKMRRDLRLQLEPLTRRSPAFDRIPNEARRDVHWVEPKLVAQIRFATWTADHLVRQAAYLGLREDKAPFEVRREEPTVAPRPKAASSAKAKVTEPAGPLPSSARPAASLRTRAQLAARAAPKAEAQPPAPQRAASGKAANPAAKKPPTGTAGKTPAGAPASLRLTHPSKVLDPESGLTKRELADFYWAVAERMLPHVANRPLSLVRCPEGAGKPCFFQKHVNHMLPPGIGSVDVPNKKTGVPEPYITLDSAEALAGFAQMGVLEVHPWGSTNDNLEHPDRLIFDLDPDESLPWSALTDAAADVRKRLKKAGMESFLKVTGGKGLHIVAPIQPETAWPEVKDAAHAFVLAMERDNPSLYLTKMTKAARRGKIYLDYLRNERGATAVAPYSPRAGLGAHVSLPLAWSALKLAERPVFSVRTFDSWRSHLRSDPWNGIFSIRQSLDPERLSGR
jgi:bifunctional non-homologous end joining protein LigD